MSIKRDRECRTLIIGQPTCVEKVLKKFGMEFHSTWARKKIFSSYDTKWWALRCSDPPTGIGYFTYVSTATTAVIAVAIGVLSQYMSRPSKDHWIQAWSVFWDMVWIFGQEMFTLEDQNQAMCFRLEETQSVSQAGNKQHLQSPLLKLHCFKLSYARNYLAHAV